MTHVHTVRYRSIASATAAALILLGLPLAAAPAHAATSVTTWADLVAAFDAGTAELALGADLAAPSGESLSLESGDDVLLDLAGFDLEIASPIDGSPAISVPLGASLTINDSEGGAVLTVTGGSQAPAIGGRYTTGTITIDDGTIIAQGGLQSAGLGAGSTGAAGTIVINGGDITATGGLGGAGIGGGQQGVDGGSITINGGVVRAGTVNNGAGIGGGNLGNGIDTTITGGRVTAKGGSGAAGIGGGRWGTGATIVISGGTVEAAGGGRGAGIGAGNHDNTPPVQRDPGTITLVGTAQAAVPAHGGNGTGSTAFGRGGVISTLTGTGKFIATSATITPSNYGQFIIRYGWTVAFDANGGAPEPDPASRFVGGYETVTLPEVFTSGILNNRWTVGDSDGPVWDPAASPTSDMTLVAVWDEIYEIDYDLAGGTLSTPNPGVYQASHDPIVLNNPVRSDHVFFGWTGTDLTEPTETVTIPTGSTGDRSYTAVWYPEVPSATVIPSISGDTSLGGVLTVDPGAWDVPDLDFDYQWYRGADAISGATGGTYTVAADDYLETLTVTVSAYRDGDDRFETGTATSADIDIPAGVLDLSPTPVISGVGADGAEVESELTVVPGTWGPTGVELSYQWRLDGDDVPGATGATFSPGPNDVGAEVTVAVTGSLDRHTAVTRESEAATVVLATMTVDAPPTITGTAAVGERLTAHPPTTTPAGTGVTYQWLRDGDPIDGATDETYDLIVDDLDADISVLATVTRDGYHDEPAESTPVTVGLGTLQNTTAPTVTGAAGVGRTLEGAVGEWSPEPTSYSYQWWRNGDPIDGATSATYLVVADDENALISVSVTAHRVGYIDSEVPSEVVPADAEPGFTPDAPDPDTFDDENRGGVEAERDGDRAALSIPGFDGRWVYVYGFSTPAGLGWHRVTDGTVELSIAALDAGAHDLAVLTADGELAGWAPVPALPAAAPLAHTGGELAAGAGMLGALLLLVGAAFVLASRRGRAA